MDKTKNKINIGLEGKALIKPLDEFSYYTYNLIKYFSIIDKTNRYNIYFNHAPLFKKNILDFKQHNISQYRLQIFPHFLKKLDIYHDNCYCFSQIKTNAKKIITVPHAGPFISSQWYPKNEYIFLKKHLEKAIIFSDAVITTSIRTKSDITKYFKIIPQKIHVIHSGVSENLITPSTYQIELFKARYSLKNPYILFSGVIEERNNILRIIEAYSYLNYESPPDLIFTGPIKWMESSISAIIKKFNLENKVKYLGYIPEKELPQLYSGAVFLIYPTLSLGFGTALLKALLLGLPIISSDIPSCQEILSDSAIFTDPLNSSKIADAMRKLLKNKGLRDDLIRKGIKQSLKFNLKHSANQTLALYRSLAGN